MLRISRCMGSFALWRRCSPDGEPTKGFALWIPASFKKLDQTFYTALLIRNLSFFGKDELY